MYSDVAIIGLWKITTGWNGMGGSSCGVRSFTATTCGYPAEIGYNGDEMYCSDGTTLGNDMCDTAADALRSTSMRLVGGMSGGALMDRSSGNWINHGANSGFNGDRHAPIQTLFAPWDNVNMRLIFEEASIYSTTFKL
jgi:hypothetical protein